MTDWPALLRANDPRAVEARDRLLARMGNTGHLFPAELQALQRAADGDTTTDVKNNLARARQKLGARNTSHAVYLALAWGHIQ